MVLDYENPEFEVQVGEETYTVYVEAKANYSYDPGCMYLRNGDPGYPPEEDFSIDYLKVSDVVDEAGNKVTDEQKIKEITDAVESVLYNMDLDNWQGKGEDCE